MLDTGSAVNIIKLKAVNPDAWIDEGRKIQLAGIAMGAQVSTIGVTWVTIQGQLTLFHVVPSKFPIRYDGMLGRGFLKQNEAVLSYYKNKVMLSGDVMHPVSFLSEEDYARIDRERGLEPRIPREKRINAVGTQSSVPTESEEEIREGPAERTITHSKGQPRKKDVKLAGPAKWVIKGRTRQVISINLVDTNAGVGYLPPITEYPGVFMGNALVTNEKGRVKSWQ